MRWYMYDTCLLILECLDIVWIWCPNSIGVICDGARHMVRASSTKLQQIQLFWKEIRFIPLFTFFTMYFASIV